MTSHSRKLGHGSDVVGTSILSAVTRQPQKKELQTYSITCMPVKNSIIDPYSFQVHRLVTGRTNHLLGFQTNGVVTWQFKLIITEMKKKLLKGLLAGKSAYMDSLASQTRRTLNFNWARNEGRTFVLCTFGSTNVPLFL